MTLKNEKFLYLLGIIDGYVEIAEMLYSIIANRTIDISYTATGTIICFCTAFLIMRYNEVKNEQLKNNNKQ